ncbi:hypothetical protein CXG81DRAFT_27966 [Caulochytrium protostelioides]|uniref:Uncharacterized protein n=1 Tax=Caulochytrium protostelioides TaxID=1555241 RepID=A0A4V1IU44_9FUNG|nr:hypothetical protein CXG81DRAFT_27966 [Caulochytrium protostelioides]|eukprot:RKO99267.1 hypothetical protein CXG81DRAFT_27966 [Caulochytrium protostelioides]
MPALRTLYPVSVLAIALMLGTTVAAQDALSSDPQVMGNGEGSGSDAAFVNADGAVGPPMIQMHAETGPNGAAPAGNILDSTITSAPLTAFNTDAAVAGTASAHQTGVAASATGIPQTGHGNSTVSAGFRPAVHMLGITMSTGAVLGAAMLMLV